MHERVRRVLSELAKKRWLEKGPGALLAKVKFGLILDQWIPIERVTNRIPRFAQDLLTREDWTRLREDGLADQELRKATLSFVPVVYCGEISAVPTPRETSFFWVE